MKLYVFILLLSISTLAEPQAIDETYEKCFKLLRTSPEDRNHFLRDELDYNHGPSSCIQRCSLLITGYYDDETGLDADTMIDAMNMCADEKMVFQRFKRYYSECAANIKPEDYGNDYCKKAMKHFYCYYEAFLGKTDKLLYAHRHLTKALSWAITPIHIVLD